MDKLEFMKIVDDVYAECKTEQEEQEIASRMKQMLNCVRTQAQLNMGYLKAGILENQE